MLRSGSTAGDRHQGTENPANPQFPGVCLVTRFHGMNTSQPLWSLQKNRKLRKAREMGLTPTLGRFAPMLLILLLSILCCSPSTEVHHSPPRGQEHSRPHLPPAARKVNTTKTHFLTLSLFSSISGTDITSQFQCLAKISICFPMMRNVILPCNHMCFLCVGSIAEERLARNARFADSPPSN